MNTTASNCSSQTTENDINQAESDLSSSIANQLDEIVPVEYFSRFSLCVLEVVRRLQQHNLFERGVERTHIIDYLKHHQCLRPYIDGDITSQVSSALKELENYGYLLKLRNGYKTLGPFAKLCSTKTVKQRRLVWKKLETKFSVNDNILLGIPRRQRRVQSETNLQADECNCAGTSHSDTNLECP